MDRTASNRRASGALAWVIAATLLGAKDLAAAAPATGSQALRAGCLPSGNGFLRARMRGALDLDLDWHDAELECDGSPRPDLSGLRLSFSGPRHSDGRRLRFVFGIGSAVAGRDGRALPTNLTIIFEGEQRLFATRGDDKCTVDELSQERVGALGGAMRTWRVVVRGFCTVPATTLAQDARILVSRFDFAGKVSVADEVPAAPAAAAERTH